MNCKKYLLGLVTMGLVTACTDLDPEIYSNLTTTNAYSTESDIEAAVVGLYSDMNPYPGDAWLYYGGYMIVITDYATDIGYSTAAGDPTKLSNMTYDASNRYFSNNWRDMYNVVSNANTILDNVDAVNMSEEKKNLVKGQAKFLRAMAYRDLTDAWGAVPFITSLVKNPFTMNDATLTPVSEIEATLISDLKEGTIGSYRQKSGFSKKTSVKVEIPKEGYIKISNDPQDSAVVNIINSADLPIFITSYST